MNETCTHCGEEFIDTADDDRVVCRECREREKLEGDDG